MTRPDFERVAAFERERIRQASPDFEHNLRVVEALYREALTLGVWPSPSLKGIEVDLRTANAFNVRAPSQPAR
jgi:hypothetical protein